MSIPLKYESLKKVNNDETKQKLIYMKAIQQEYITASCTCWKVFFVSTFWKKLQSIFGAVMFVLYNLFCEYYCMLFACVWNSKAGS